MQVHSVTIVALERATRALTVLSDLQRRRLIAMLMVLFDVRIGELKGELERTLGQ